MAWPPRGFVQTTVCPKSPFSHEVAMEVCCHQRAYNLCFCCKILFLLVRCSNPVMDSDHKLELRQMGRQDSGCEVRSVFAIVGFPAETGNRLCFCWRRKWPCPATPRLRRPAPPSSLVVGRFPLARGSAVGLGACLPALRCAAAAPHGSLITPWYGI